MEYFKRIGTKWRNFKFTPDWKSPLVLRTDQAPLLVRVLLLICKLLEVAPLAIFRHFLYDDTNERLVEYPFIWQNVEGLQGKRVLDFGCTESAIPIQAASLGAEVVGVDLRPYGHGHENFTFREGDFISTGVADAVACIYATPDG